MKRMIIIGLFLLCLASPVFSQDVLNNTGSGGTNVLNNPTGVLNKPLKTILYYNNQSRTGYLIWNYNNPFLSVDSVKTMFSFNDMYDTDQGSYMVNGRGVDTYYYANHLFLDINQFCNASGLTYHFVNNGAAMVFLSTSQQLAAQPGSAASPVRVVINGATTGSNPDPINNCSYIYTVGLTNTTGTMITVNHFNFLVMGASGARYTSVKNMGYVVVFGDNDTPDALSLDPGQGHTVTLTFDLPENDTPRRLVILQGQSVLGSAEVKDGY